jgi:surface protein
MKNACLAFAALITLSGCFKSAITSPGKTTSFAKSKGPISALTTDTEGEKYSTTIDGKQTGTVKISSPKESNLSGVSVAVSPGTFSVSTILIIEEGVSLNDSSIVNEVGITDQVLVTSAGQGTIVRPSEPVSINRPLNISLPLNGSTKLALAETLSYAVFYKYQENETGRLVTGVFPVDNKTAFLKYDESIQRDVIYFEGYFGQYWPVVVSRALTADEVPAVKESIIPIVNKSLTTVISSTGVVSENVIVKTQALPSVKIEKTYLTFDPLTRTVMATADIDKSIVSCKVDLSENTSSPNAVSFDTNAAFNFSTVLTKLAAHTIYARFRCLDLNGKLIVATWSDPLSIPAATGAPVSGASTASINYSKISLAADGFINNLEKLSEANVWGLVYTNEGMKTFTAPFLDMTNSTVCGSNLSYSQPAPPRVLDLSSDGIWSACARIVKADGTTTFVKAQSVTRDTVPPVFVSMLPASEASDGYISYNERNLTTPAWSLLANGQDSASFTSPLTDTGASAVCAAARSYTQSAIPTIVSFTADGTYFLCVQLSDLAGNRAYGKSSVFNRRTVRPVVSFASLTTQDQTPALSGQVTLTDAVVVVTVNGQSYTAVNNGNGTWQIPDNTISTLPYGFYSIHVLATDPAGNSQFSNAPEGLKIVSNFFISTWKTDNGGFTASNQISLPLDPSGTYNFIVDWGDSTSNTITAYNAPATTHTYATPGTYTVKISGVLNGWRFANFYDRLKILNISAWGPFKFGAIDRHFEGAANLTISATDQPDISSTQNFFSTFAECGSLTSIPNLEKWNMGSVTSTERMFAAAVLFNQPLNSWNVSSVTNFKQMFANAYAFNGDISSWDVGQGMQFDSMFLNASAFDQNIGSWDLSSATNVGAMFRQATAFNRNLNAWNVSSVTNFNDMFRGATQFNGDISGWNTASALSMTAMFEGATKFNRDISGWNVSSVTNMERMFNSAIVFNQHLNLWNVSAVTNMSGMFAGAAGFNSNITNWNVSYVTHFTNMFHGATIFNQDIGSWTPVRANDMSGMFGSTQAFNQNISGWNVGTVANMQSMFEGAVAFNQNINTWNVGNVTNFSKMFAQATLFNSPLGSWSTVKATDMSEMFKNAVAFNQNISAWTTPLAQNMKSMFQGASSFNVNLSSWNVAAVTSMESMFQGAISFNQNLANWNISNVISMAGMFYGVTLSTTNYDALLMSWATRSPRPNVNFNGGNSKYTPIAVTARSALINSPYFWTIVDGGPN